MLHKTQFLNMIPRPMDGGVELVAQVPDVVQVAPATRFDAPEFGSAQCRAFVYWEWETDSPLGRNDAFWQQFIDENELDWEVDPNDF